MKKILGSVLVLLMAAMLLTGCGKAAEGRGGSEESGSEEKGISIDSIRTLGDVIALEGENKQSSTYEGLQVYVFELNGRYYRARAELPEDVGKAVWETDFTDEEQMEKLDELLAPIEITKMEDLTEQILTEDERKALVGKTGQELMDAGWYSSGYNLETMEFWMNYGPFLYTVVFDGKVEEADWADFNEEMIGDRTVRSVEFLMLGDATIIE